MSNVLFDDMVARETFVELVAAGVSPINAGIEVGWTPRQTKANLADPEFQELVDFAEQRLIGSMEQTLVAVAQRGNVAALTLFLFNRAPDRWRDVKRIEVKADIKVTQGMVEAVKTGALELLREHGVGALQALEAGDIEDAEIVE